MCCYPSHMAEKSWNEVVFCEDGMLTEKQKKKK